ncbi:MAG: hypothetical protein ACK5CE_23155 [Actinomycetes bacterium]
MGRFDPAAKAARLAQQVRTTDWKGRAKQAVQTLKDEYEAGKRGDDTPAQPIWASPREQLDAVLGLLRSAAPAPAPAPATASDPADTANTADVERDERRVEPVELADDRPAQDAAAFDADADEVAEALRRVDWTRVRAATAERSSDAARTVRAMAEQVDWTLVQPVAAQVSSALIAAVASGQLGVGGRLGTTVARAIVDQGGLGQHVAARVASQHLAVPAELRRVIDATARDA